MTIEELLPDEPANIVHKRILRGVMFRREPGEFVAECENAAQAQYIDLVVSQVLLAAARRKFRDSSLVQCVTKGAGSAARRTLPLVPEGKDVRRVPHPEHSFNIYVPGEKNRKAVGSILRFADSARPGRPTEGKLLYIYGPRGCGKTHLTDAVVNEWVSNGLQTQTYEGRELLQEISSSRGNGGQNFGAYWRIQLKQAPYLAIDGMDVFMAPRMDWLQADLQMILRTLGEVPGYAIVTGIHAPDDEDFHVDPDLAALFQKAEVVELRAPDLSMRRTIAWNCFQYGHVGVADDLLDFIVHSVVDVPQMLLICHSVSMLAASGKSVGIKDVQSILHRRGVPKRSEDSQAFARKTVAAAIEAMGERVPLERITGRRIGQEMATLRNRIVVQLVEKKKLKQKMVAEALGLSTQMVSLIVKEAKEGF